MPREDAYKCYSVTLSTPARDFRKRVRRLAVAISFTSGYTVTQGDALEMLVSEAEKKYNLASE